MEPAPSRGLWSIVLVASATGIALTTAQILERISMLRTPGSSLVCDIGPTVSCTEVLGAWQSSVLGPPNAWVGGLMFAILGSSALAAVTGSRLSRGFALTLWGLAAFFLCFATWFMHATAFDIGSLCLWCVGITTAVVIICAALTRVAQAARALGDGRAARALDTIVRTRLDLALWAAWWFVVAGLVAVGLLA